MVRRLDARGVKPAEIAGLLRRPGGFLCPQAREAARGIVEDVREKGDEALVAYTERFDGVRQERIRVPVEEIETSQASLPPEVEESFLVAFENVRAFHARERSEEHTS